MSFVVCGMAVCGLMGSLFLLHALRNAPDGDSPEAERLFSELDRQTREIRRFT